MKFLLIVGGIKIAPHQEWERYEYGQINEWCLKNITLPLPPLFQHNK